MKKNVCGRQIAQLPFAIMRRVVASGMAIAGIIVGAGNCFAQGFAEYTSNSQPYVRFTQTTGTGAASAQWTLSPDFTIGAFRIQDTTNGHIPFSIEQGAPHSQMYLHQSGRVGLNTYTPEGSLHIAETDALASPRIIFQKINGSTVKWSLDGAPNFFSIRDLSSGAYPFNVAYGSPGDALTIRETGFIGLGRYDPAKKLHLYDTAESPTIRFEEASSTPHTWDLVADHVGFDVVDVTSGATPLAISPGAPTSSLFVNSSGYLGLGTNSPATQLHVRKKSEAGISESLARFEVSDDTATRLEINNASNTV